MRNLVLCVALLSVAPVVAVGQQMDPKSEMIFTEKLAVALLPPVVLGQGVVQGMEWAPDGKRLFYATVDLKLDAKAFSDFILRGAQGPPPGQAVSSFSIYDVDKQKSTVLWTGNPANALINEVHWLNGGKSLALSVREPFGEMDERGRPVYATSIYVAPAGSVQLKRVLRLKPDEFVFVSANPGVGNSVIGIQQSMRESVSADGVPLPSRGWTAHSLTPDGRIAATTQVLAGPDVFWQANNKGPLVAVTELDRATSKRRLVFFALSFNGGELVQVSQPDHFAYEGPELGFTWMNGSSMNSAEGMQVLRKSIWLKSDTKSEHQYAMIAADADAVHLSPAGNGVAYNSQGITMLRPIANLPKDLALRAIEAAERTRLMNETKQAALGLMMYAADYDDILPNGDVGESVMPYVKNQSILDGFIMTLSGNLSDVKDPANTELGYKAGKGGRAVAYADGHVKWVPNPEPVAWVRRPRFAEILTSKHEHFRLFRSSA